MPVASHTHSHAMTSDGDDAASSQGLVDRGEHVRSSSSAVEEDEAEERRPPITRAVSAGGHLRPISPGQLHITLSNEPADIAPACSNEPNTPPAALSPLIVIVPASPPTPAVRLVTPKNQNQNQATAPTPRSILRSTVAPVSSHAQADSPTPPASGVNESPPLQPMSGTGSGYGSGREPASGRMLATPHSYRTPSRVHFTRPLQLQIDQTPPTAIRNVSRLSMRVRPPLPLGLPLHRGSIDSRRHSLPSPQFAPEDVELGSPSQFEPNFHAVDSESTVPTPYYPPRAHELSARPARPASPPHMFTLSPIASGGSLDPSASPPVPFVPRPYVLAVPPLSTTSSPQEPSPRLDFDPRTLHTFYHSCSDYHPLLSKRHEYFQPDTPHDLPPKVTSDGRVVTPVVRDVISVVVPCFTESARNLRNTLYDLWRMQEWMWRNRTFFEFHVCLILDGWSKAPPSLQAYIHALFESEEERELQRDGAMPQPPQQPDFGTTDPMHTSYDPHLRTSSEEDDAEDVEDEEEAYGSDEDGALNKTHARHRRGARSSGGSSVFNFGAAEETLLSPEAEQQARQTATATWERYIANWSADSESNPPTQPETLIIQKWSTMPDGRQTVAAIPIFGESDLVDPYATSPPSEEELDRKRRAALKMTVIIKRDNRRKHNSHDWFLQGFAPVYTTRLRDDPNGIQFVFMTDAGTRFHDGCAFALVQHCLRSPSTVACSGRQRVMTHAQQNEGEPPVDKWTFSYARSQLYRCAQGFEYEASISSFNGAFDWTGMLPVLPGPCGLFRLDLMLREGTQEDIERAKQKEKMKLQVGKLRQTHANQTRALTDLHAYVWQTLTITRQMQRVTWTQYCQQQHRLGAARASGALLEPFTPYEKKAAQYKFVELRTQLFALTNELTHVQRLLTTVLLRLQPEDECLTQLSSIVAGETAMWQRQQSLLVLVKQLHELESAYSSTIADRSALSLVRDWDKQMHLQLGQLKKLITQQIYRLKEYLFSVEQTDGVLLSSVTKELSLDPDELDYILSTRALEELAQSRDPIEFYFKVVNQVPSEVDLITANLMLAEDRILSYAVVLMADRKVHTDFVPDALFFFEAELESENALQQSRRWTNGTVAGFIWLFFSGIRFRQARVFVYVLVFCQLIMYLIVALSPALWTLGLHFALSKWFGDDTVIYTDGIVILYLALYASFVLLHSDPTPGKPRLHTWLFHVLTVCNMFVAALPLAALVPEMIDECPNIGDGELSLNCWVIMVVMVGTLAMPFILAILYDLYSILPAITKRPSRSRSGRRSCPCGLSWNWSGWGSITYEMVTSVVFFYLYLPTKVSIYPCYSFSRTWELTWGNKPSDSLHSLSSTKTPRQLEQTKKNMLDLSRVISHTLLIANLLFFLLVSESGMRGLTTMVLTIVVLAWSLGQMAMSLLWLLVRVLILPVVKATRLLLEWAGCAKTRAPPNLDARPFEHEQNRHQRTGVCTSTTRRTHETV